MRPRAAHPGSSGTQLIAYSSQCYTVSVDVERAIEHLLELHARAEARMEKADARMDRADARLDRLEKQLTATANLVRAGAKIVRRLAIAQRKTDQRFDRLIGILARQSRNGRR